MTPAVSIVIPETAIGGEDPQAKLDAFRALNPVAQAKAEIAGAMAKFKIATGPMQDFASLRKMI